MDDGGDDVVPVDHRMCNNDLNCFYSGVVDLEAQLIPVPSYIQFRYVNTLIVLRNFNFFTKGMLVGRDLRLPSVSCLAIVGVFLQKSNFFGFCATTWLL